MKCVKLVNELICREGIPAKRLAVDWLDVMNDSLVGDTSGIYEYKRLLRTSAGGISQEKTSDLFCFGNRKQRFRNHKNHKTKIYRFNLFCSFLARV